MSLDFYRATSKENIDYRGEFVGLEDELQEYLYKKRDLINCDVKCIYEIDPYSDTELDSSAIKRVMVACKEIKIDGCLDGYDDEEEAQEVFTDLEILCKNALESNQNIFAIGD